MNRKIYMFVPAFLSAILTLFSAEAGPKLKLTFEDADGRLYDNSVFSMKVASIRYSRGEETPVCTTLVTEKTPIGSFKMSRGKGIDSIKLENCQGKYFPMSSKNLSIKKNKIEIIKNRMREALLKDDTTSDDLEPYLDFLKKWEKDETRNDYQITYELPEDINIVDFEIENVHLLGSSPGFGFQFVPAAFLNGEIECFIYFKNGINIIRFNDFGQSSKLIHGEIGKLNLR